MQVLAFCSVEQLPTTASAVLQGCWILKPLAAPAAPAPLACPAYLPACPPARLPACPPACLPACLPACRERKVLRKKMGLDEDEEAEVEDPGEWQCCANH